MTWATFFYALRWAIAIGAFLGCAGLAGGLFEQRKRRTKP